MRRAGVASGFGIKESESNKLDWMPISLSAIPMIVPGRLLQRRLQGRGTGSWALALALTRQGNGIAKSTTERAREAQGKLSDRVVGSCPPIAGRKIRHEKTRDDFRDVAGHDGILGARRSGRRRRRISCRPDRGNDRRLWFDRHRHGERLADGGR
ncbi:hypothetical protein MPL1032_30350 [Mesorhizobium plurifarium]|uniref:Uncharacterized protein n=1 Tax=Mesorhizobium plurifarium TaxID=69974 RepID=A0A0K2W3E6_MESPL|nr:hypothetical protein MPL1032_30350 [Mesorhizobium plurifarium]